MKELHSFSKRRLLKKAVVGAFGAYFPGNVLFANDKYAGSEQNTLEQKIVKEVKLLAKGRDLTVTILQPKGSLGNLKPIADIFSEQTGVQIEYIEASVDEINAKIMAQSLSSTTNFDIALPATFGLPDLIEAGAIRDLDEFVDKYEPNEFSKDMLYSVGDFYKGKFYGYQTDGDTYVMFYNNDWLQDKTEKKKFEIEYGYPLDVPKTWEQLDQMIRFFHRPDEKKYGGALYRNKDYIAWEWWVRFHAKGFFPFDNKLSPQINNESGVKALSELVATSNYLYPNAKTNGLFENWEAFAEGNMFCNIGWGGTQKYLNGKNSKIRNNLAFGPTPGGFVNNSLIHAPYFNWGWNYTVSSFSNEPEISYLFTLFACSPAMSTKAVQYPSGYFDPFRVEHYDDPKIQATYSKKFLDAHKFSMKNSIPDLYLTGQGEYWDVLKENIDLADRGKMSPKFALEATADTWDQISTRYGKSSQLEQWEYLKTRYPDKIRKSLI
ncbi:MAG: extracellular solute-binding protein [Gammaproteobacteria bacterium]